MQDPDGCHITGREATAIYVDDQLDYQKSSTIYSVKFRPFQEGVESPKQGSLAAAGYDLCAAEEVVLHINETRAIPLGFATEMHPDIHCRIESRSGMALRGMVVLTGVIDADYRGEWMVIMRNFSGAIQRIAKGERVAQAVFRPTVRAHFQTVSELSDSARGAGGFGSTGR